MISPDHMYTESVPLSRKVLKCSMCIRSGIKHKHFVYQKRFLSLLLERYRLCESFKCLKKNVSTRCRELFQSKFFVISCVYYIYIYRSIQKIIRSVSFTRLHLSIHAFLVIIVLCSSIKYEIKCLPVYLYVRLNMMIVFVL